MNRLAMGHQPAGSAWLVIAAGACAALHIGKLPPAMPVLQAALGISLLEAGVLLSAVQLAGMLAGAAVGLCCDSLGLRRSMLIGLLVLAVASALGGFSPNAGILLALRVAEGFGFLLVSLPAPALIRRLVPASRLSGMLGFWGAYMPLATALALLVGPWVLAAAGWRAWWIGLAALTLTMGVALRVGVAADPRRSPHAARASGWSRLCRTLGAAGPWLTASSFAMYSGQWLAVVGFLPSIYLQAGVSSVTTGWLTALVAGVNMLGNVASGRLLHRGVAPPALLRAGFIAMALSALLAFGEVAGVTAPPVLRYAAVLVFSMVGGIIPGTLFSLAVRFAPDDDTVSTTVGWMQQCSALGQFCLPPVVAWVAGRAGGWHWTWAVTGLCSVLGLWLASRVARRLPRGASTAATAADRARA